MPFSFAYHFAPAALMEALEAYRATFRPSEDLEAPYVMLGVSVIAAETQERARWLAGPSELGFVRLRSGRPDVFPTPEEAAEYRFTPFEREQAKAWMSSHVVGAPAFVRGELETLVERTGADELMISTMVHSHADRVTSYRLLADVLSLRAPEPVSGDTPVG